MDTSISPAQGADTLSDNVELPCPVASLSIDGVAPEVGDQVDLKVTGPVTRVVNDMAWIRPENVNNSPMEKTPIQPSPDVSEKDRLRQMSQNADMESVGY